MPKVLALAGYEFPSNSYLHPHPLHGVSHLSRPLTQLERTEKEVSHFWNSPLAMSKDFPHILARKL